MNEVAKDVSPVAIPGVAETTPQAATGWRQDARADSALADADRLRYDRAADSDTMKFSRNDRTRPDDGGSKPPRVAEPRNMTVAIGIDESLIPVYQQSWWLEIARGAHRFVETRVFQDGIVVGSLPYIVKRSRLGIRWGASPDWCHLGGPVVSQGLDLNDRADVLRRLVAQLPRHISIGFSCGPNANDREITRQAFKAAGFVHTTESTYSQSPSEADVLSRLTRKHRLHIRSAAKMLAVTEISEDEFVEFYGINLEAAALRSLGPLTIARDLIAKGRHNDPPQIRVIAARRKTAGAPLDAAIACAWDKVRYYLWMSTRRRHTDGSPHEKPHPDAIKVLIVEAMTHARDLGLIFDADGVNTPGAKTLYREILRIPNEEIRDVFERLSPVARCYRVYLRSVRRIPVAYTN